MSRNVLKSSIHSASINIVFQILCRCITFGINSFVIRIVDRDALGIMNVRLLLLESTLAFLSREAIRRATLSSTSNPHEKHIWPHIINQLWLTLPIYCIFSVPCLYVWLNYGSAVADDIYDQYKFGCICIVVSGIIELFAETPVFVAQVFCFVKLRVVLDTLHIFVRSTLFIVLILRDPNQAISAFSYAQVGSTVTFAIGYYVYFIYFIDNAKKRIGATKRDDDNQTSDHQTPDIDDSIPFNSIKQMLPGYLENSSGTIFNDNLKSLVLSFFKQGFLKQVLTEGERYVMTISPLMSFSQQATYDIVNNLGSLAARFVFRPIEENSYFYFTQTLARDIPLVKQPRDKVEQAHSVLYNLLKVVTSIGLIGVVYGQSYAKTVLTLYGGTKFVDDDGLSVILLRCHALAIILLAVNGICEGYMFATMTSNELDKYNYYMGFFSVTFLLLSYQLTSFLGPVGFILANCTNMFLRIIFSSRYIHKQYHSVNLKPLDGIKPNKLFFITLIVLGIACKMSENRLFRQSVLGHIAVGAICFACTLGVWAFENQDLIKSYIDKRRQSTS
ncbi:protein RFT1 homolog [Contarinia nasturtii]|uniref:protein RFT1 homolog n=1 Tax=Contarinia nasturtii TaxID=265458 RepID=UPI0012D3E86F|nr:protein RFT1 homolog [Contarinia nasturtii]